MRLRLIGLSVSACIRDIIENKVDEADVVAIVGGTDIKPPGVEKLIESYSNMNRGPWKADPVRARHVFMRLWEEGRIIQPRQLGLEPIHVGGGMHWAVQADLSTIRTLTLMKQVEEDNHVKEHQGS